MCGLGLIERVIEMQFFNVRFLPEDLSIKVASGTTLMEARRLSGQSPDAPCGGKGLCNKCMVEVEENGLKSSVKSCQYIIKQDISVEIYENNKELQIQTSGIEDNTVFKPLVYSVPFKLSKNGLDDLKDDWTRFTCALAETSTLDAGAEISGRPELFGKISFISSGERGEGYALMCGNELLEISSNPFRICYAAFDIGTTTIAGYLIDSSNGQELANAACINSQIQFGGDVVSRASFAADGGIKELARTVRADINNLITELTAKVSYKPSDVAALCIVGNTCMNHLFLGIEPHSLVRVPYNASVSCKMTLNAREYGINAHPSAKLLMLPLIAGFVGADTVGCLLTTDFMNLETLTLMIDIGTNGELVLGDKNKLIACSTAAGPAFEGAKITCGVRAAIGAIDHVHIREDGTIGYSVIGGGKPSGICGSGMIDAAAALFEAGLIVRTGRMLRPDRLQGVLKERFKNRLQRREDETVFYLALPEESLVETGVFVTQKDIRELQLGKSAIATGICLLSKTFGVEINNIDQVLIAGGFGNHIKPESLCKIGMIPDVLKDRIRHIGNAAGVGAKLAIKNQDKFKESTFLAKKVEFLELALNNEFQKTFISHLDF